MVRLMMRGTSVRPESCVVTAPPIAGQGVTTTAAKQTSVTGLLAVASLGVLAAMAALLVAWRWQG